MGVVDPSKNVFKLGAQGLKQARAFIQLFAGQNKSKGKGIWNPKVIENLKKIYKETGLSITKISDMARKRIGLESSKVKGTYYPKTDKYYYDPIKGSKVVSPKDRKW